MKVGLSAVNIQEQKKKLAGEKAVEFIKDGATIGLGSGSTVYWMLKKLGERIKEGLKIKGVPSSVRTEKWAKEFGIPLTNFNEVNTFDIAIDGADEVDKNFQLLKGGGGSLVREKIVAQAAKQLIIIIDDSKIVSHLGKFPLPVEVLSFGWEKTARSLDRFGCEPKLRVRDNQVFVSDNHNFILDCHYNYPIKKPEDLHKQMKALVGVVETGLFTNMADIVIVGKDEGVDVLRRL